MNKTGLNSKNPGPYKGKPTYPQSKTCIIDGKTIIKCGKVEITDKGRPFTTKVLVDGKVLTELYSIQSFKYEVLSVNGKDAGQHKLTIKYYPYRGVK